MARALATCARPHAVLIGCGFLLIWSHLVVVSGVDIQIACR